MRFGFDHSYARDLPGAFVPWKPTPAPAPRLLYLNEPLARELGLDPDALRGEPGAALFSGNALPEDAQPIAQAYAGHQFGGFSPQLGDGRALLIGELIDRHGRRRDVAFKGSGRTPFSRGGDGRAVVAPMLREVLIGEAMHALGIPTTRALAVAATGESVYREAPMPGAVLTRVAASHLRVGSFQFFAARGDREALRRLVDHAVARHDPSLVDAEDKPLALLGAVVERQASLIAQWMNVGFIHGVMNTDNMTISGETIDYGPCAFLEAYDPETVFSSIDHGGRYAYGNQPNIGRWNLTRFAEALLPAMVPADDEPALDRAVAAATAVLERYPAAFESAWRRGQRAKLGLRGEEPGDAALADEWLRLLQADAVDWTQAWRALADVADGRPQALHEVFAAAAAPAGSTGPLPEGTVDTAGLQAWLARWQDRCARDDAGAAEGAAASLADRLRAANPAVIPRNHRVEDALAAAMDDDLQPFERLLAALQRPYDPRPEDAVYAAPAPRELTAGYRTYCGT